jgi:hypothetical protein
MQLFFFFEYAAGICQIHHMVTQLQCTVVLLPLIGTLSILDPLQVTEIITFSYSHHNPALKTLHLGCLVSWACLPTLA